MYRQITPAYRCPAVSGHSKAAAQVGYCLIFLRYGRTRADPGMLWQSSWCEGKYEVLSLHGAGKVSTVSWRLNGGEALVVLVAGR